MFDRQGLENREPEIGHLLVLHRAADEDIVVAVAPIRRKTLFQTVNPFGEKVEIEVLPLSYHIPTLLPPRVSLFQQEVGGKAGKYHFAARDFVGFVPLPLDGKIERGCLPAQAACHSAPVHLILPVDIAILAARTYLCASVPRIPILVNIPMLAHLSFGLVCKDMIFFSVTVS